MTPETAVEPIEVWCPACEEPAGRDCRTFGTETPRRPHQDRRDAAKQADRVGQDPAESECGHCGASPGEVCRTVGGNRRGHHTRRGQS